MYNLVIFLNLIDISYYSLNIFNILIKRCITSRLASPLKLNKRSSGVKFRFAYLMSLLLGSS
ncbi:hypothetical protein Hanom_Chr17g01565531 [Helianthus anomalus]